MLKCLKHFRASPHIPRSPRTHEVIVELRVRPTCMRSAPRLTMVEGVIFLDDVLERAERHIVKDGDWASLNKAEHEGHLRNGCVHDPNMLFKLFKQGALTGKQVYPYKAILVMGRDDHEIVVERSLTLEEVRHRARETKDD